LAVSALSKIRSLAETLTTSEQHLATFPLDHKKDEALLGLLESIKKGELMPVG